MRFILQAASVAIAISGSAEAQDIEPSESSEERSQINLRNETPVASKRLSVDIGGASVTQYISRGIAFAEEPSFQPFVTVTLALPETTGGAITDANVFVGTWNSIKLGSVEPGEAGQLTRFYETDLYAGGAIELDERWRVSATYYRYVSLGKSFDGYNDLELIVSFDDAQVWRGTVPLRNFTLSPSLRLVQEAGRPGRPDALYIQPSLTPSFEIGPSDRPVRMTVPLVLGFSDKYYDKVGGGNETFGFFRTGVSFSSAPFPQTVPALDVEGGFDLWILNDEVVNGLGDSRLVGRIGVRWTF